jgi:hypothetical protein
MLLGARVLKLTKSHSDGCTVPALRKLREEQGTHCIGSCWKSKSLGHPSAPSPSFFIV